MYIGSSEQSSKIPSATENHLGKVLNSFLMLVNFQFSSKLSFQRRYNDGVQAERPGIDSQQGQEAFLFSTTSRTILEPTQPPIQCVPGSLSRG
jgi:hypothetical protein